jgi:P-type Cu+ transporter
MRAQGPVVDPVQCSGCGKLIDPLRAGHVAIFAMQYHFFCNRSVCRAAFLGDATREEEWGDQRAALGVPRAIPRKSDRSDEDSMLRESASTASPPSGGSTDLPPHILSEEDRRAVEPLPITILTDEPGGAEGSEGRDVGTLLLVIAVVAGSLGVTLGLAGRDVIVLGARLVLTAVGAGMVIGRASTITQASRSGVRSRVWRSQSRRHSVRTASSRAKPQA